MKTLKYLITGTGRCGTVYAAKLLTSLNIPTGHESIFTYDGIEEALNRLHNFKTTNQSKCGEISGLTEQDILAESSYMAAPYLKFDFLKDTKIIHLVRHPLNVVNSFVNGIGYFKSTLSVFENKQGIFPCKWHDFIYKYLPELKENMDPYTRACLYYIKWNELIEKSLKPNDLFHKLEDGPTRIFQFLDIESPLTYYKEEANSAGVQFKYVGLDAIPKSPTRKKFEEIMEKYDYKPTIKKLLL